MKSRVEIEAGTRMLSAIALFCYAAALAALFALGYSLAALAINAAGQQIGASYSPHGM